MKKFLSRHADQILGVLSGFDRIRFRGTFRQLAHVSGMQSILDYLRMQSWLPFNTHLVINGREWLGRQMDAKRLKYTRADNCFTWVEDFDRAQKLANQQLNTNWPKHLNRILYRVNPALRDILPTVNLEAYWSAEQSEWATDVAFRSAADLTALHARFVQHAMTHFQSPDVMRFLGRKTYRNGKLHPGFQGEVVSDVATRQEGVRVKHRVGGNSVKMYNKQGSVLRVETTINDARDLTALRPKEGDAQGKLQYRKLRKGVADLRRRAQLCQSANQRYLDSLAATDTSTPLKRFTDRLSQPVITERRRFRALNPLGSDASLLAAINQPEYLIKGFRNVDIRTALLGTDPADPLDRRRRSARISRLIALLRAHGLVKKIPQTQRYQITAFAQQCVPAIMAAREASLQKLLAA